VVVGGINTVPRAIARFLYVRWQETHHLAFEQLHCHEKRCADIISWSAMN